MQEQPTPEMLAAEFDTLMHRAGITVPPSRRAGTLASYANLRSQIALLHGRYGPQAEPSNIFRLTPAERP
ncbi:MAG: hypothetical protein AB7F35_19155 [Acetobacteraceae bacterium]